jgi:hypothetical protein
MTNDHSSREFRTFLVRRKGAPLAADPTVWATVDGNSLTVTVGGTASDGNYVITFQPVSMESGLPVDRTDVTAPSITVVRATTPASNTNIATQFVTNGNTTLLASSPGSHANLSTYLESLSSSGAVVTLIIKRGAPRFRIVLSETTATGTLTAAPDDELWPVTFSSLGLGPQTRARTHLEVVVIPVDAAGVQLPAGTLTTDLTVRRYFDRGKRSQDRDIPTVPVGVSSAEVESALPCGTAFRIPGGGGRFGFSLGAAAGLVGSGTLDTLEVYVREVTE